MRINFKRNGVAAWLFGASLIGIAAGCGGGGATTPTTDAIIVPPPVAGTTELLFGAIRAADNASKRPGIFFSGLNDSKTYNIPISGFTNASDQAWLPGRHELLYVGVPPKMPNGANRSASSSPPAQSICRVNRDGTNNRVLADTQGARALSVSPDGHRVAYVFGQISVVDLDGSNMRVLRAGSEPSWSPDSQRLVFSSSSSAPGTEQSGDIYVMNADGSNPKRLTTSTDFESAPQFSPDGSRIVFSSIVEPSRQIEIFVMNADGSNRVRLTNNTTRDSRPKWTRDGQRIVFIAGSSDNPAGPIQVMNADGSNQVQLRPDIVSNFDLR